MIKEVLKEKAPLINLENEEESRTLAVQCRRRRNIDYDAFKFSNYKYYHSEWLSNNLAGLEGQSQDIYTYFTCTNLCTS